MPFALPPSITGSLRIHLMKNVNKLLGLFAPV
jgi:hypothetical protein